MLREKDRRIDTNCRATIRMIATTKTMAAELLEVSVLSVWESGTPKTVDPLISEAVVWVIGPRLDAACPEYV